MKVTIWRDPFKDTVIIMNDGNEDEEHLILGIQILVRKVLVRSRVYTTCANSDELISLFHITRG